MDGKYHFAVDSFNQRAHVKKYRGNGYDKGTKHRSRNKLNQKSRQYSDQIVQFERGLNFIIKRVVMGS